MSSYVVGTFWYQADPIAAVPVGAQRKATRGT
jgi:hypothetical protein